jgi:hypothetical protein
MHLDHRGAARLLVAGRCTQDVVVNQGTSMLRSCMMIFALAACAPVGPGTTGDGGTNAGGDAGPAGPEGPSDLFFRGVGAGSDAAGDDLPVSVVILIYEPALSDVREDGALGADPEVHDANGTLFLPGDVAIDVVGTFTLDGTYHLEGAGWQLDGTFAGTSTTGSFTGPAGETGDYAGEDMASDRVAIFCGSFDDGDSTPGVWNLTVSSSGLVSGVFQTGGTHGFLSGTATGTTITIEYEGDCGSDEEGTCTAIGTANGTIDENGTITGTFSGTHFCSDFDCSGEDSGSFTVASDDSSCPGGDAVPTDEPPPQDDCLCAYSGHCTPCGQCCWE